MNGGDSQPEERICSVICTSVSFATRQQGEQTEAGDVFQYILRCCAGAASEPVTTWLQNKSSDCLSHERHVLSMRSIA